MSTENTGWITIKDTHYGSCHEKADGSAIVTSMWDMHNGGLRWSVHYNGNGKVPDKTFTNTPPNLKAALSELIQRAKEISVKEGKYEIGATIRELEKQFEAIK